MIDESLIADFEGWLNATARRMTNPADADDLAQEGRIALWRAIERADLSNPGWPGFVTRAAKGRMIDVVNAQRPAAAPGTTQAGRDARERIRAAQTANPGATGAQLAAATGLSASTVSTHLKRMHLDLAPAIPVSLEAAIEEGDEPATDDILDDIVAAYMVGRIAEALDVLTPNERRYVRLRFWEGYQKAELTREFGYDPSGIWRTAKQRLRPRLLEILAA